MAEIDWSKAPEWATHAMTTDPKWDGALELKGSIRFARLNGVKYVDYSGRDEAVLMIGKKSWVVAQERPTPQWSGTGLPPIGLRCEAKFTTDWVPFELLYLGTSFVVFKTNFEVSRPRQDFEHSGVEFRPIRTAEQIAADEREAAIHEIAVAMAWHPTRSAKSLAAMVYDAGYRKQEPKP